MTPTQARKAVRRLALLAALVTPPFAAALTGSNLRDLSDPVTPGGILSYRVTLQDATPAGPPVPTCFNPPADCVTMPVTCTNPPPTCAGNPQAGYVCQNAANNGANCGVGTPPSPNPSLCIQRASGVCNGGNNNGLACSAPDGTFTSECPGFTFVCRRAANEGDYCGATGPTQPQCLGDASNGFFCADAANNGAPCGETEPDPSECDPDPDGSVQPTPSLGLSNQTGICSGGPNFGQPCTVPHGQTTPECPSTSSGSTPTTATVDLPMPSGTTFIDADNGGTSNGTSVVWTVPAPAACAPSCAALNTRLLVDALVPEGTRLQSRVTTTDQDGFLVSAPQVTTIARMQLQALSLSRGSGDGRGRVAYRSRIALNASESLDPGNEAFAFRLSTANGLILELPLAAGQVPESGPGVFVYRGVGAGIRALVLKQLTPTLWKVRLRAANLTVPPITSLTITIELTIGGDVFTKQAQLFVRGGGKRFVANTAVTTTP